MPTPAHPAAIRGSAGHHPLQGRDLREFEVVGGDPHLASSHECEYMRIARIKARFLGLTVGAGVCQKAGNGGILLGYSSAYSRAR